MAAIAFTASPPPVGFHENCPSYSLLLLLLCRSAFTRVKRASIAAIESLLKGGTQPTESSPSTIHYRRKRNHVTIYRLPPHFCCC